jgi:hypothetical protein
VCEIVAARPSKTACFTVPRTATMNAAIIVFECPGSKPCNAPRRMALGMNSHAWETLCWNRIDSWVISTHYQCLRYIPIPLEGIIFHR